MHQRTLIEQHLHRLFHEKLRRSIQHALEVRLGAQPQDGLLDFVKQRAKKRVAISLLPQKWASWDHGTLRPGTF